jgi:hypothetical protein
MLKRLFASRNNPCFANPSRWDTLVYDLSGNRLEITLPPQDYEFAEEDRGRKFNVFDPGLYKYNSEPDRNGYPAHYRGITTPGILRRNWDAYGSIWLGHPLGKLQCAAVICDTSRMPAKLNCFNPEQMERLFIHALYYNSGPGFDDGRHEFDVPVNWQIKQLHGVEWVYCESWDRQPDWEKSTHSTYGCHFTAWLAAPLFADKYLLISFSATGSLPAAPSNRLRFQRIEKIIPSITLRFSPEAQKQRDEAQRLFPNAHYSKTRKPEAWKYYESYRQGDMSKGEKEHIFEGPCSPPPPFY